MKDIITGPVLWDFVSIDSIWHMKGTVERTVRENRWLIGVDSKRLYNVLISMIQIWCSFMFSHAHFSSSVLHSYFTSRTIQWARGIDPTSMRTCRSAYWVIKFAYTHLLWKMNATLETHRELPPLRLTVLLEVDYGLWMVLLNCWCRWRGS